MEDAIFLSAGVPDLQKSSNHGSTADIVAITAAVSALIYVTLGRRVLIWGGHPAITPMIWVVAQDIGIDYASWVQLYQSRYFKDEFPEDSERFHNVIYTDSFDGDRERSLLSMRERMFTDNGFKAAVFIGGMGGIKEEYNLFRHLQPKGDILPIASTGGAAFDLALKTGLNNGDMANDLDYVSLFHNRLGISARENRYQRPSDQPKTIERRFWR